MQIAKLNQSSKTAPMIGDVLRACSCTNLVYPTQSLFGVKAPIRTIVMYGADNQKWPKVWVAPQLWSGVLNCMRYAAEDDVGQLLHVGHMFGVRQKQGMLQLLYTIAVNVD